jgi:DNA-binding NarL/FixJ family response regulator
LSGDSHPDTPERLRSLGANAFFPKPYSPSDVRHTLEDLLNGS